MNIQAYTTVNERDGLRHVATKELSRYGEPVTCNAVVDSRGNWERVGEYCPVSFHVESWKM